MPQGSGRKSATEWNAVANIPNSTKVKCKQCDCAISSKIERIRAHLLICRKQIERCNINSDYDISIGNISDTGSPPEKKIKAKRSMQSSITDFTIKTTPNQKEKLDKIVAKFFFANNIAFNVADSDTFKDMIELLRPGYTGPSRKQLADKYLPEIDAEITENLKNDLNDSSLTLILDGWSNTSNDSLTACSVHTGLQSYLISAEDAGSERKTTEYCVAVAEKAIHFIKRKYDKDIFACCTDNENKMKKMKDILKERHNIITYGCSAHILNLLYKDIIPKQIATEIIRVHKYFRNHHQPHGWLKEKQGVMPQLPNDVRWNSYDACVSTFIFNYHFYVQIGLEHIKEFDNDIHDILSNVHLYNEAWNLHQILYQISIALKDLQNDYVSIATAVEIWYNLVNNKLLITIKPFIEKRMKSVLTPAHYLANMMHPKYLGKLLTEEAENMAEEWINRKHPTFLAHCLAFKIQDREYFPESMFKPEVINILSAKKWWKILNAKNEKTSKLPENFCNFFISLLSCPASSASIERIFSSYGLIWNKLRNRLGFENALSLVKIYRHLRSEPQDY